MESSTETNGKNGQYYLPTYGFKYPTPPGSAEEAEPPRLFRPVQYYSQNSNSQNSGEETTDEEVEEEELDMAAGGSEDSAYSSQSDPSEMNGVEVKLHKRTLWRAFMNIGNEMIVTKPGRSLFPTLLVSLRGLNPKKEYSIYVRVAPADSMRYKYLNMKWCPVGESDVVQNEEKQILRHSSSPNSGLFWMRKPISFKNIKITNNARSKNGNILLHTMNKYVLKVIICPMDKASPVSICLPETTFIAVSAYQSMEVTQMKIDNNPFAKAFKYQDRTTPTVSGVLKSITESNPDYATAIGQRSLLAKHGLISEDEGTIPADSVVVATKVTQVKLTTAAAQPTQVITTGKANKATTINAHITNGTGHGNKIVPVNQASVPTAVIQKNHQSSVGNHSGNRTNSMVLHPSIQPVQVLPSLVSSSSSSTSMAPPTRPITSTTNTTTTTTNINPLFFYPSLVAPKPRGRGNNNHIQSTQPALGMPLTPPTPSNVNPLMYGPPHASPVPSSMAPMLVNPAIAANMMPAQSNGSTSPILLRPLLTAPMPTTTPSTNPSFGAVNPFLLNSALQLGINPYLPLLSQMAPPFLPSPFLSTLMYPRLFTPPQQPPPPPSSPTPPLSSPTPSLPPSPDSPGEIIIDV